VSQEPTRTDLPSPEATMALLRERRSIRRYRLEPVPDDLLEQVLEAGRWAPSASNRQPWAFIVARDAEVRKEVAAHASFYFVRWVAVDEAPVMIVLCGYRGSRIYAQYLHEDVGLAGGQMMLQAKALGLGTCWIGGLDRAAIAAIVRLPEDWEVVGILTLGFPDEDPRPTERKPLADVVHYDLFGLHAPEASPQAGRSPGGVWRTVLRHLSLRIGSGRAEPRRSQQEDD
jgi:nitroreductase